VEPQEDNIKKGIKRRKKEEKKAEKENEEVPKKEKGKGVSKHIQLLKLMKTYPVLFVLVHLHVMIIHY
jgi:pheromone shutdown protein TraB